jgi:hypothetical protein
MDPRQRNVRVFAVKEKDRLATAYLAQLRETRVPLGSGAVPYRAGAGSTLDLDWTNASSRREESPDRELSPKK